MTLSRGVGDLAPGDQKITLNHLVLMCFVSYFGSFIPLQFPLDLFFAIRDAPHRNDCVFE